MNWLIDSQFWLSLLTLTVLEIVMSIDNLVVISLASHKLPKSQQNKVRRTGLSLAVITRLLLLLTAVWLISLTYPLFTLFDHAVSMRDLFLIAGGVFLLTKATGEIHAALTQTSAAEINIKYKTSFFKVVLQIILLDILFSFDSIITAVGMSGNLKIMAIAIIIAMLVMVLASNPISYIINKYPSIKMLALCFLMMIALLLIMDGCGLHIPRGYLYVAMLFSCFVEIINIATGQRSKKK